MQLKSKLIRAWKKMLHWERDEKEINYCEAIELMNNNSDVILLDVRSIQEYNEYHLNNAINIPLYELRGKANEFLPKTSIIIVYCQSGTRSKKACKCLKSLGYCNLYNIKGGLENI